MPDSNTGEDYDCRMTCEQILVFLAATGKIKSSSGEVTLFCDAGSSKFSRMLNRGQEFLRIMLIGPMTNISHEECSCAVRVLLFNTRDSDFVQLSLKTGKQIIITGLN